MWERSPSAILKASSETFLLFCSGVGAIPVLIMYEVVNYQVKKPAVLTGFHHGLGQMNTENTLKSRYEFRINYI